MPQNSGTLWQVLARHHRLETRHLHGLGAGVCLASLADATCFDTPVHALQGCSVLLACRDQLAAALALIELDGVARRIVLVPPDIAPAQLPALALTAATDAFVSDGTFGEGPAGSAISVSARRQLTPAAPRRDAASETEWVLLTSGTTGEPKLVLYTRAILSGAITVPPPEALSPVWSTFYDIRRYGGLQIFLRAILAGGSLVLTEAGEPVGAFLARAGGCGVTHISGTPSHWRRAMMSGAATRMAPGYVRLSGEIADQTILDALARTYPNARIAHAFASTEAGVGFDVGDGRAGFPADLLVKPHAGVEMKIVDGTLRIRSPRTAIAYLGIDAAPLKDAEGFVDTGDMIVRENGRCVFAGRKGGVINVGGAKVFPEEVEAVLNRHPAIEVSRVMARKSAFTGALVVAEVVVRTGMADATTLETEILEWCREALPPHKVPALLKFVPMLDVSPSGKLVRRP